MSMNKNELYIIYGEDIAGKARQLLEAIDLDGLIAAGPDGSGTSRGTGGGPAGSGAANRAGAGTGGGSRQARIVLKPNLVVAAPASSGATTHPELVGAVIDYLQEKGYRDIAIIESSWLGDSTVRAWRTCGYEALSKRTGVPLIDVKADTKDPYKADGMTIEVSRQIMQADFLISFPVLKGHCQTNLTCALKNMKGVLSENSKRQFHSMGLHKPIALLNTIRAADLVLVDGICGDLDFEEGGNPVPMNRLIAGRDSVLVDRYAADLLGFAPEEVPYIGLAEKYGVGSANLAAANLVELNENNDGGQTVSSRKVAGLVRQVVPAEACSACYGSLVHALARLQEKGTDIRKLGKLYIGQGFKGKTQAGIGIGSCTAGFDKSLRGCPPKAIDIMHYLENEAKK